MKSVVLILHLLLVQLVSDVVHSTKGHIHKTLQKPLKTNDRLVFRGQFLNRRAEIRLISDTLACPINEERSAFMKFCQPMVLAFKPQFRQMVISSKGSPVQPRGASANNDHEITKVTDNNIKKKKEFNLEIKVGENSYTILLNGRKMKTIDDAIGHDFINQVRCNGASCTEFEHISAPTIMTDAKISCGKRPGYKIAVARIVNGQDSKPGEFPWQVALRRKYAYPWASYTHMCGGSLIAPCWVVTAAHCVESVQNHKPNFVIRVGDRSNSEQVKEGSEEDFDIDEVIIHPEYSVVPTLQNDIALVRLPRKNGNCASIGDFVQPICLPSNETFSANTACTISGWGAQNWSMDPLDYPHILQKGRIRIIDKNRCRDLYGLSDSGEERVYEKTVCAAEQGIDSCQGDSGGPLACLQRGRRHSSNYYVLWGITSWGEGCANFDRPGIYTRVADFVTWIKRYVDNI